jgi:protein-L-isoaspartate(D-aspartate) O-methyltransferase
MNFKEQREHMVDNQLVARGVENERVLAAFQKVPREEFVPKTKKSVAYQDSPLQIGNGQTISQPYTVARMTELLDPRSSDRVLEIGTGSGYQAAVLAEIVDTVITIERISKLAEKAKSTLDRLNYENVKVIVADGSKGWEEEAPFDGIIITAAAEEIPQPLFDQLAVGGRLVAPVGNRLVQEMVRVTKTKEGLEREGFGSFRFVPLIRN